MKVKIIGAGSIGNHLAQAARRLGWQVAVVDHDPEALKRMKEEIYPKRYGAWDESIELFTSQNEPKGDFDIICIGTPPDVRMKLALEALREKPRILQLEKPLCTPSLSDLNLFLPVYRNQKETIAVVGYDHAVSASIEEALRLLEAQTIGRVETIDVEFREHWRGIFAAHPWLAGPQDTYLGFWQRGGGAGGEHSHALHLWQLLARVAHLGQWEKVSAVMNMKNDNNAEYDSLAAFLLITNQGKIGRVIQDVITSPVRKWARIQGEYGFIEWFCNGHPTGDLLKYSVDGNEIVEKIFNKTRPDDFYREMLHIKDIIEGKISSADSPISLESALSVMAVLATAYKNRNQLTTIMNIL